MKATITYGVEFIPHPWNDKQREQGVKAWCIVEYMTPEQGPRTVTPVAIFDLDSAAERFQGHVFAEGLNKKLITIDPSYEEIFEIRERWKNGG